MRENFSWIIDKPVFHKLLRLATGGHEVLPYIVELINGVVILREVSFFMEKICKIWILVICIYIKLWYTILITEVIGWS
ncbi:hypothetical protein DSECCO2_513940 [anaerobic digester metagenome]|jgi:hypothetical protein